MNIEDFEIIICENGKAYGVNNQDNTILYESKDALEYAIINGIVEWEDV
jgi:hypothetical protein